MATTYISVIVTDRQGKGKSGVKVSTLNQQTNTDSQGVATVSSETSKIAIFVQGSTAYDGLVSGCPNPLRYTL